MDWNKIRKTMISEVAFFDKLNEYDFHGPKGAVKSYQMTNHLLATVKQMEAESYA